MVFDVLENSEHLGRQKEAEDGVIATMLRKKMMASTELHRQTTTGKLFNVVILNGFGANLEYVYP